jgi:hypothetical protein
MQFTVALFALFHAKAQKEEEFLSEVHVDYRYGACACVCVCVCMCVCVCVCMHKYVYMCTYVGVYA